MGGGGPQATRFTEKPVDSSGISVPPDATDPATPPTPGPAARRSPARVVGLLLPPLALMGLVWFLSAQPDLNSGLREDFLLRKCAHVTEFAVLTALWARAIAGLRGPGGTSAAAVLPAALVALVWAAIDERHQHFVQGRVGAVHDVAIDAIGIVLAVAVLRWTRLGPALGVPRPGGEGAGRSRRGRPRAGA